MATKERSEPQEPKSENSRQDLGETGAFKFSRGKDAEETQVLSPWASSDAECRDDPLPKVLVSGYRPSSQSQCGGIVDAEGPVLAVV